jgi:hypothetical protein
LPRRQPQTIFLCNALRTLLTLLPFARMLRPVPRSITPSYSHLARHRPTAYKTGFVIFHGFEFNEFAGFISISHILFYIFKKMNYSVDIGTVDYEIAYFSLLIHVCLVEKKLGEEFVDITNI